MNAKATDQVEADQDQEIVHTPGPWYCHPGRDDGFIVTSNESPETYGGSITGWGAVETTEANARLMAEAPAMRKALEDIRAALNRRARNDLESEVFHIANRALSPLET